MMGLFGTLGKAVGIGGFKQAGGAMGIPVLERARLRGVGSMDPAAKDRMRAALTAGRNDGSIKGPMGMLKFATSYRDTPPPVAAPPPQMAEAGMAPPPPMAGPSPLQAGIQEMIGPQESNPYEAWKAGGRQGDRPAGY